MNEKTELVIKEDFLNPQLFLRILKSLLNHDKSYEKDIDYRDHRGESIIIKLRREEKEINIAVETGKTNEIKVIGESHILHEFVRDISVEMTTIFCSEFCLCLTEASYDEFKEKLRLNMKEAINSTLDECGCRIHISEA
ncbi:MAG: hypothetical protein ACFFCQ_09855 [Promethearchaeota archaeon]